MRTVEFRDLTESKRLEAVLSAERDRAGKYFDVAGIMLMVLDRDGIIKMINKKGVRLSVLKKVRLSAETGLTHLYRNLTRRR